MTNCGQCKKQFKTNDEYMDHVCEVYGATPRDPESMGPNHAVISKAALERGEKRVELEAEGKTKEEAITETRDIGKVIK